MKTLDDTPDSEGTAPSTVGPYELVRVLGHGGVGIVYEAEDVDTDQRVALKLLTSGERASVRQRQRFEREVAAQSLEDPGIVRVLDRGGSPHGPWYAMELVEGGDLAQAIATGLQVDEAVRLVRQVAETLDRLHRGGRFHRDIKPSNVLLSAEREPKLADFGLVLDEARETRLTRTDQVLGTPRYMAPEQLAADVDDWGRVDLYALGLVLYEALGGKLGRTGRTGQTLTATPELPADLLWICQKAAAWDPLDRYPTGAAMAEDLSRWQQGLPVRLRPTMLATRAQRWVRRHREAAAAGALLVLLSAAVVGAELQSRAAERAAEAESSATWAALRDRHTTYDAMSTVFDGFVDDPQHHAREAASEAHLWRAQHPDAPIEDALFSAALASAQSSEAATREAANRRLAQLLFADQRWTDLAALEALAPEALTPAHKATAALAHQEWELAGQHVGSADLFRLFAMAEQTESRPSRAAHPVWQADVDAPVWTEDGLALPPGAAHRSGELISGPDGLIWLAKGQEWVRQEHAVHRANGSARVGERLFITTDLQSMPLVEWTDEGPVEAHRPTTALRSYATSILATDLDQDGQDELVVTLAQPSGYGLRVFDVPGDGPIVERDTLRLGHLGHAQEIETPAGPRLLVARTGRVGSVQVFDEAEPYGGAPALLLVELTAKGLAVEREVPLPGDPLVIQDYLTVVDLDGDGLDEVLLAANSGVARATVLIPGGLENDAVMLPDLHVVSAGKVDDAPVLFGNQDDLKAVTFGLGEPLDAIERRPVDASSPAAWLASIGLARAAAELWQEQADADRATRDASLQRGLNAIEHLDPGRASHFAEQLGDTQLAAELARRAMDLERAAALDPELAWLADPEFQVDLSAPLDAHIRMPAAVRQDLAQGHVRVTSTNKVDDLLVFPLVATGEPLMLDVGFDIDVTEWSSRLTLRLRGEASNGLRATLVSGGSGGLQGRGVEYCGNNWDIADSAEPDRLRVVVFPDRCGFERDGRWHVLDPQRHTPNAGDRLELVIGDDSTGDALPAQAQIRITHLRMHGVRADPDADPPQHEALDEALLRAVYRLEPWRFTPGTHDQAFVAAWSPRWAWREVEDGPMLSFDALAVDPTGALRANQARALWRVGRHDEARQAALDALEHAAGDWIRILDAHSLLAEIALSEGDRPRATDHARKAVQAAPDTDLGRRMVRSNDRLKGLADSLE